MRTRSQSKAHPEEIPEQQEAPQSLDTLRPLPDISQFTSDAMKNEIPDCEFPPQPEVIKSFAGEIFYAANEQQWRKWLFQNHTKKKEIYLYSPHKETGLESIPYYDAVRQALCFGWIDGVKKKYGEDASVQRYTPRVKNSSWSELNKHHARVLISQGLMTPSGYKILPDLVNDEFQVPDDIMKKLRGNRDAWTNYQELPEYYRRLRLASISRMKDYNIDMYNKKVQRFIEMTKQNKRYGPYSNQIDKA